MTEVPVPSETGSKTRSSSLPIVDIFLQALNTVAHQLCAQVHLVLAKSCCNKVRV